ncbi:MAG: hypothetical protein LBV41_08670 [Cytophagaceae bacterium]|jgi:hypothetical protein|nr:hypothetical protein [Cytophagaceae bacterium]
MPVRKIASHYILNPDGSIGKSPIVTFSENGQLLSVSISQDKLIEQPSLEFYGGLLIPGLIDDFAEFDAIDNYSAETALNRHFASGTFMLRCSERFLSSREKKPVLYCSSANIICNSPLSAKTTLPLFERIKHISLHKAQDFLPKLLHTATTVSACNAGVSNIAGSFVAGLYPALLVIENMNLAEMKLTVESRIKWLIN